jgi:hypothetical protein
MMACALAMVAAACGRTEPWTSGDLGPDAGSPVVDAGLPPEEDAGASLPDAGAAPDGGWPLALAVGAQLYLGGIDRLAIYGDDPRALRCAVMMFIGHPTGADAGVLIPEPWTLVAAGFVPDAGCPASGAWGLLHAGAQSAAAFGEVTFTQTEGSYPLELAVDATLVGVDGGLGLRLQAERVAVTDAPTP